MPDTVEKIKSYNNALEQLCTPGHLKAVENALRLCHHLLPAASVFVSGYQGSLLVALQDQRINLYDTNTENYFTAFLSHYIKPGVFSPELLPGASADEYVAVLPLANNEGLEFGQVGWIANQLTVFDLANLGALQLAASQLSALIISHAATLGSKAELNYCFDKSPLAIVEWDSSFRVLQWSAKAEEMFGWKSGEVIGLTTAEFNIVHPDAKAILQNLMQRLQHDTSDTHVIENKNLTKDGQTVFCRWHNTVKRDDDGTIQSIFAMVENISAIKLANENLHHSEEQLEENKTALGKIDDLNKAIIGALPDLMFRLTNEGVFADYYISDNDGSSLYIHPSAFLGRNVADVLPAQIVEKLHHAFRQLDSGQKVALYNYELPMGNEVKEYESRVTRINDEGYLSIVRDITEAKKAQQQVIYENELMDAVAQIGSLLLSNEGWHKVFEKSLSIIGGSFRTSGAYFFELQPQALLQESSATIRYEWLNTGAHSQMQNAAFTNISLADNREFWDSLQLSTILTATTNEVRFECLQKLLTSLQSQSVIVLPLLIDDELFGVIVLNEIGFERVWTKEEQATLGIICNNLVAAYETNRTQNKIKKVNELFGYVMKATNDLIWDWDIEHDKIERSDTGFKNLTGFDYEEVQQTVDFWSTRVHPDDKELMQANFTAALENPEVFFWENNFRFLKKDGFYSYLADRCYIIRNTAGKAVRAIGAAQDITQQKIAVLELANSEQRFRSMIYNISDVITLIDREGIIMYQSASSKRILGFEDDEIVGKNVFTLLHEEDVERVAQSFNEALLKEGDSPLIQFRFLTKSGTFLAFEAIGNNQLSNPAIHAMIVVSRDITERQKAGEAIRSSEEKFRSLVHNISDIISIISPAGQILYQSSSVKQKMGYAENELSNRSIAEIVHPEDLAPLMNAFGSLIQTGGTSDPMEFRIMNKDGSYFYIEAQATNQIDNPTIQGIVITSRDISQRKKTEEERKILIEELTKNNADLTQFSYIVSHDLRAPLTNLISMIKLLDFSTIQNPRSLKLLEGFKISTFKLRDTLNDLTDVLLVKNNPNVEIRLLDFEKVFKVVSQSINSLIEKSGANIHLDFKDAPLVKFSEPYLESIFQNLLTNSIRYASQERQLQVNVTSKKAGANILLSFNDNGMGFNMDVVKGKIFGLHQRFHHHPESRGIGLYLIHSQITSLGGTITVQSEEGTGTTFFITLKNS